MDNFVKAVQNNNALYCSLFFKKEPDANAKKKMANAQKDGFYVAHWACFHDNVQLLLLLMHYGANMGCKTLKNAVRADVGIGFSKGTTLLHACAVSDSPACITALLEENKVDANAKDALGRTALHLASSLGHAGVVKAMLMSSFNHDLKIDSKCPVDSHTSTQGVWVRGSTALMRSARASADIMRMLLATGRADPTARDDNGWTVAHYAAEGAIPEIIDLLVENKVPMNARSSRGSKRLVEGTTEYRNYTQSGFTPLHVCVRFEHKDEESALKCIDALVSVVDVNATDVRGWTALHWACYRSMFEVVRRLLDSSVDRRRPFDLGVRSTGLVVSKIPTRSDHDPRSSSLARRPTSMYSQRLSGMGQGEGDFQVLEFTPGSTASDLCCIKDAFDCVELLIRFRGRWSDLLEKHAVDEEEEEWVAHARGVLAAYHPSELELFLEAKLDRLQQVQARHDRLAQEVKQQHQQQQQQQQHQQQQQQLDEKQPQQLEKQHGAVERVPHSHEEKGEKGEEEEEDSHAFMYTHKRMGRKGGKA
jgi:ankyrin repeat protein